MAKYIDKSALVAEIKRRMNEEVNYDEDSKDFASYADFTHYSTLDALLNFIDTLEVKEVDLKQSYREYIDNTYSEEFAKSILDDNIKGDLDSSDLFGIMSYGFELGIKAKKDNIRHSMNETPNYPCDILFVTNVDNMFLYRYMENGRPVDNETPYFHNILNGKCWYYCNDIVNK